MLSTLYIIVFGCADFFDNNGAVFFQAKAFRRRKNNRWALECTLAFARVLPTRASTHWSEDCWERWSDRGGYSLFLQVRNTFHLDKKQILFLLILGF